MAGGSCGGGRGGGCGDGGAVMYSSRKKREALAAM
jgi:hypothetical protein